MLLRAVVPLDGVALMAARRHGRRQLADGPGKLCQAFGLDLADTGRDICRPGDGDIGILDDGTPPPPVPVTVPSLGVESGPHPPTLLARPAVTAQAITSTDARDRFSDGMVSPLRSSSRGRRQQRLCHASLPENFRRIAKWTDAPRRNSE